MGEETVGERRCAIPGERGALMPEYLCIVGWPLDRACEGGLQEVEEVP